MKKHKSYLLKSITFALMIIMVAFVGANFLSLPHFYAKASASAVGSYEDLDSGLRNLYNKFGIYQQDEVVISNEDLKFISGEGYVDTALVGNLIDSTDEVVSLASLEADFEYVESEDSLVFSGARHTNRIIVYYEGSVPVYNTNYYAEGLGYHIFQYETKEETDEAFRYYSQIEYLDSVEYDYVVSIADSGELEVESQATTYLSWGAAYTGVAEYNAYLNSMYSIPTLPVVYVAILDSGINTRHSLFSGRISEYSKSFVNSTASNFEDQNGHGTHVAGIIADQTNTNVQLIVLQVLDSKGGGSSSSVVNAIKYVESLKNSNKSTNFVMNMSLGIESKTQNVHSSIEDEIKTARSRYGVLSVVAAGNGGDDEIGDNTTYCSPANTAEAIVIAAVYRSGNSLVRAVYSNWGSTIDFCAPGSGIYSAYIKEPATTYNNFKTLNGTSMATPHASAVIALLYSNPDYASFGCDRIEEILKTHANYIGTSSSRWDNYYGYGCINIANISSEIIGTVEFSEVNQTETQVSIQLTFDKANEILNQGYYYQIRYTTNGTAPSPNSENSRLYNGTFTINSTTLVTAIAYIYKDSSCTILLKKSKQVSKPYILGNIDLDSNYDLEEHDTNRYMITKYYGSLKTLKIPTMISDCIVDKIASYAFQGTKVENVILSDEIVDIQSYAFYGISTLKSIEGKNVYSVGNYAFSGDAKLEVVKFPYIEIISTNAFNNCTSIRNLSFVFISSIATNAFRNLTLDSLEVGGLVQSFSSTQDGLTVENLYAYTGVNSNLDSIYNKFAENVISTNGRLRNEGYPKYVIPSGNAVNIKYTIDWRYYLEIGTYALKHIDDDGTETFQNDVSKYMTSSLSTTGLDEGVYNVITTVRSQPILVNKLATGKYEACVIMPDVFDYINFCRKDILITGNTVAAFMKQYSFNQNYYLGKLSDSLIENTYDKDHCLLISSNIVVVDALTPTHQISFGIGDNYDILIDGVQVDSTFAFYEGVEYDVEIITEKGYYFRDLEVCGYKLVTNNKDSNCKFNITVKSDSVEITGIETQYVEDLHSQYVTVSATASQMERLDVTLSAGNGVSVLYGIGQAEITTQFENNSTIEIDSGSKVKFKIVESTGYNIESVLVNGVVCTLNTDNTFEISNVYEPYLIEITTSVVEYTVTIKYGNGGIITSHGFDIIDEENHEYKINVIHGNMVSLSFMNEDNLVVDSITINDVAYDLTVENKLVLEIKEDTEIVVSFREVHTSIFGKDQRTVLSFFAISVAILIIWIVSKIILHAYRERKRKMMTTNL